MFHIYKQSWDDRLVYALLLEKARDPDSFKRAGLVQLACYDLFLFPESKCNRNHCFDDGHSIYNPVFGHSEADYETEEWQKIVG